MRYSSALVHDSIVTPFSVLPGLAPTVTLAARTPLRGRWSVEAMLDGSTSQLERRDPNGATANLGRLTAVSLTIGLERRIRERLAATLGVGALRYSPATESGIFRSGAGALAGLGALTLEYRLGSRFPLAVAARYDVHAFSTPALQDEGFGSPRAVHRLAITLRAATGRQ